MRTHLKVLNFYNASQVHSVECVSKIKSVLTIISDAIFGALCIQLIHFSYDDFENMSTYLIIMIKSAV